MFLAAGAHYVVPDFAWVQDVGGSLKVLADQVRRAIAWVYDNAALLGSDPKQIYVGGQSSGGHLAALVLLAAAGLAIAASLVKSPPATPAAAARRIAIGLTALFLLSPATRFGYFIYPISLYAWAVLADREGTGGGRRATVDLRLPDAVRERQDRPLRHMQCQRRSHAKDPLTCACSLSSVRIE